MRKEEWKKYVHEETGKTYYISSFAKVKSLNEKGEEYLHTSYTNNGYRCIPYRKPSGKNGLIYIHKIIAKLFVPNPDGHEYLTFINGDSSNCMAHNLKWISKEENRELNRKRPKPYDIYPNYAPHAKLSKARVAIIKKRIIENEKKANTNWNKLAKQFGITPRHLWLIRKNKIWAGIEPAE